MYRRYWGTNRMPPGMYRTTYGMYKYAGLGSLFLSPFKAGYNYFAKPVAKGFGKFVWGGTKYGVKTGVSWGAQSAKNILKHISHPSLKSIPGIAWEAGMFPAAIEAMKYPKHAIEFLKDTAGNITGAAIMPMSF